MKLRKNILVMMTAITCCSITGPAYANDYIPAKMISYESFPEYTHIDEGVQTIDTTGDEIAVTYKPDIPYVSRKEGQRTLQILLPHTRNTPNKNYPLIVYIQGSAWLKQDVLINQANLAKFAARGYAIAIVQYRETDLAPFPAQIQDTKTAIRFMRMHAKDYHIDTNNVFVWGDSSGGHTSVMTGITENVPALDTNTYGNYSTHVNAIVDVFGPTDIRKMNDFPCTWDHREKNSPEGKLIGGLNVPENEKEAQKTVAENYISKDHVIPPVLILHGNKDRIVPYNQSELLHEKLKESQKDVTMYRLKGADHGDPAFWSEPALNVIDNFLKKNMH